MTTIHNQQALPGQIGYANGQFGYNQYDNMNGQPYLNQPAYTPGQYNTLQPSGTRSVQTSDHSHCLPSRNGNNGNVDKVIFRPIEGRFNRNTDFLKKMDPYCKFRIGWRTGWSKTAWSEGKTPNWAGEVVLKRKRNKQFAHVTVRDRDLGLHSYNNMVGQTKIDLNDIAAKGKVKEWFPVYHWGKPAGEVLLEIEYVRSAV